MNRDERLQAITELEAVRDSRVIAYLTADRGLATAPIAEDVLRVVYDHLRAMGKVERLDLYLYSRGGDAMLPWPLVNVLRSFCNELHVLIPFRAHSAAALISLGADGIVMTPVAELTPVEPTVTTHFNPADPTNPGRRLGINVEDVAAYFQFAEERAGIESETGRVAALGDLTKEIHPVALGHVHRSHKLASYQARKLLELHMDRDAEHAQIEEIVERMVSRFWAHEYKIGRGEARSIGLKAHDASPEEEEAIWKLFEGYEVAMELRTPIMPMQSLFPANDARAAIDGARMAYVESASDCDAFVSDFELTRTPAQTPPGQPQRWGPQVQVTVTRQEWEKEQAAAPVQTPPA